MSQHPMPTRDGYVAVPGGRVWYQVVGEGSGVPLLALHGGPGGTHYYFEPLLPLADERPLVLYDQLGSGRSDRPGDLSLWRIERFVAEIAAVRDALGLDRVHLLGHSWGTMLAADYLLTQPPGIVSRTLVSPLLSTARWVADQAAYRLALPPDVEAILTQYEEEGTTAAPEYEAAVAVYFQRHGCRLAEPPAALQEMFAGMGADVYQTMWGSSEFYCTGNLRDYDRTAQIAQLGLPLLFACGRYDQSAPATVADYQRRLPGAELVVFEQSAHLLHLEEPDRFVAVLRDFLRRAEQA
jgi:proline iminopeptidase